MNANNQRAFLVFAVCTLIWLAYDGYVNWKYGLEATISYLLCIQAYRHPVIPLVFGLVIGLFLGHLFWPVIDPPTGEK